MNYPHTRRIHTLVIASSLAFLASSAHAIPFGTATGGSGVATLAFSESFNIVGDVFGRPGWLIGAPNAPNGMLADSNAGPWRKYLIADLPNQPFDVPNGFTLNLVEVLWAVNDWTEWHEVIGIPRWSWAPGSPVILTTQAFQTALDNHTAAVLLPGLSTEVTETTVDFRFDPVSTLSPETTLVVFKSIVCFGASGCTLGGSPDTGIILYQYPVAAVAAPEPNSFLVLGLGLLAARFSRRRH